MPLMLTALTSKSCAVYISRRKYSRNSQYFFERRLAASTEKHVERFRQLWYHFKHEAEDGDVIHDLIRETRSPQRDLW